MNLVDRIGCVTVLTLNRPRQPNVLSVAVVRKLLEVYAKYEVTLAEGTRQDSVRQGSCRALGT